MQLREGEQVLKVFHHHPTPFVFALGKIILGIFPFFLFLYLFESTMDPKIYFWCHVFVIGVFVIILKHHAFVYWMDRLIITDKRVIYVNWKFLTIRDEDETELADIQDIHTKEKGLLAAVKIFDYGLFKLQTASHITAITFDNAPDPEGIRHYIYHIKPN